MQAHSTGMPYQAGGKEVATPLAATPPAPLHLFADSKTTDQIQVSLGIVMTNVVEQTTATTDHP
jgi:hypothetical protein